MNFTGHFRRLRRHPGRTVDKDGENKHVSICTVLMYLSTLAATHGHCVDEAARDTVLPIYELKTVAMNKLLAL